MHARPPHCSASIVILSSRFGTVIPLSWRTVYPCFLDFQPKLAALSGPLNSELLRQRVVEVVGMLAVRDDDVHASFEAEQAVGAGVRDNADR